MLKRFVTGILCISVSLWVFAACGGGGNNNSNSNINSNGNSNTNNNNSTADCTTNPTYSTCIQPIFQKSCGETGECHGEGSSDGSLTLIGAKAADLKADAMGFNNKDKGRKIVVPGKPMESLLYLKLLLPGERPAAFDKSGSKMPLNPAKFSIDQAAIDQIKLWIENGAKAD